METEIILMCKYQDNISGFKGIAVGITEWAWGCITVGLACQELDKDGKVQETEWFDQDRLILLGVVSEAPTEATGGPENMGPGEANR